ncbi:MAG: hypothetical protein JKY65_08425 [Planctomycetes bacterium]|nr:hypothetical protein [Planctomycetota bacterium]
MNEGRNEQIETEFAPRIEAAFSALLGASPEAAEASYEALQEAVLDLEDTYESGGPQGTLLNAAPRRANLTLLRQARERVEAPDTEEPVRTLLVRGLTLVASAESRADAARWLRNTEPGAADLKAHGLMLLTTLGGLESVEDLASYARRDPLRALEAIRTLAMNVTGGLVFPIPAVDLRSEVREALEGAEQGDSRISPSALGKTLGILFALRNQEEIHFDAESTLDCVIGAAPKQTEALLRPHSFRTRSSPEDFPMPRRHRRVASRVR